MDTRNRTVTIGELLDNPRSKAVLQKHLPKIVNNPMISLVRGLTMKEVLAQTKGYLPAKKVEEIIRELERI
ncbi:MAG: hypothetical protein RR263_01805 [Oscillospiraceae bacterium]